MASRVRTGRAGRAFPRSLVAVAALATVLAAGACSPPDDAAAPDDGRSVQDTVRSAAPSPAGTEVVDTSSQLAEPFHPREPHEGSEVGQLVKGFPEDLLPVPHDAVILVTSAVPVGEADVQEVSLNLTTSMSADDLLEMYRTTLVGAGFTELPPGTTEPGLAAESLFTRSGGDELVSIGVLDQGGSRTVTVGGRVHTGS